VRLETWAERFIAARIDVDENTRKMYRSHTRKIGETFGDRDPFTITASEIAEWISVQAETRKAGHARPVPQRLPLVARPRRRRAEPRP
jgi:hypothetical protein